jgi:diacylglycerol kinase (ATP)
MSVDEVCAWLETLELGEYCERFRANKIDGELLLSLEERDLEEDFAMENKYHRRRLLRKLHP